MARSVPGSIWRSWLSSRMAVALLAYSLMPFSSTQASSEAQMDGMPCSSEACSADEACSNMHDVLTRRYGKGQRSRDANESASLLSSPNDLRDP